MAVSFGFVYSDNLKTRLTNKLHAEPFFLTRLWLLH